MVCEDFLFSWDFSTLHHSHPWFSQGFPRVCRELSKPLLRASSPLSTLAGAGAEERRSFPLKLWTLFMFKLGVLLCFTIVQGDASNVTCFMPYYASHCFARFMAMRRALQGDASRSTRPCFMLRALQGVASCCSARFKALLRALQGSASCFIHLMLHVLHDVTSSLATNSL